jgi:hypothetical protein
MWQHISCDGCSGHGSWLESIQHVPGKSPNRSGLSGIIIISSSSLLTIAQLVSATLPQGLWGILLKARVRLGQQAHQKTRTFTRHDHAKMPACFAEALIDVHTVVQSLMFAAFENK